MTPYRSATTTRARLHSLASALACLILLVAVQAAAKDISVKEAAELLQNPPQGLTIVDVRTPAEFREGHLAGAVNMDFFGASFDSQILALPKDKPILLYCRSGNRSAGAYDAMEKEGITNILHMNQGITAWQQAGLPLQK
ncbi:rhodanese-like domain-containing protein [Desulfovibrio desulfuricans]|uniref:rhodanese-like domain-containing protein n=1 Tax=Desulfovibrio desulfuricans TaxID=876 RepID=UPI0035B393B5